MSTNTPPVPYFDEIGCYIDGWWGQYGPDRLVDIAAALGFTSDDSEDTRRLIAAASDRAANLHGATLADTFGVDYLDMLVDLSDEALEWINENQTGAGLHVDWHDGELWCLPLCDDEPEDCTTDDCWHQMQW